MQSNVNLTDALQAVGPRIGFDGDSRQAIGVDVPVCVINLARRPDRWQAVSSRMAAVGLNKLVRVSAVDGAVLPLDSIGGLLGHPIARIEAGPRDHFTLTRPAIGCFLSHIGVWQWMIDNDIPRVMVFEDDARPAPAFEPALFCRLAASTPPEGGLLFLGSIIMDGLAEKPEGSSLARLYFFNGAFAYVITPAAARRLMARLLPMQGHIDHQISTVLIDLRHEFVAWYSAPALFEPDWSLRSDCYVPLTEQTDADRELGALFAANRRLLLAEGRRILPPYGGGSP
jgi:GR25 family glycosyltransferase involved in LPS biosynthesis